MKVIIIEDEKLTAEDLADAITRVEPGAVVIASLSSVKEALEYFKHPVDADLIFSDIQLGDGLSFEIFRDRKSDIPVIFCTAYDEYALNAFKTNGIHYILKPFSVNTIKEAMDKYKSLQKALAPTNHHIEAILSSLDHRPKVTSVLVHYKDQIIPVSEKEIALACIRNETTLLKTFDQKSYFLTKTLDDLESKLGTRFFRANRQYLVNRSAVKSVENYGARKLAIILTIPHDETITVSKEKHTPLMNWLEATY
jgi:two-component system response regulator LytT